jgi:metallo-beta-lactamase family protein
VEQQRSITIKERAYPVRAKIKVLNAFSAHADKGDLLWWANACGSRVKKFFLVHGEQQQSEALRLQLQRNGRNALVPSQGQVVELD